MYFPGLRPCKFHIFHNEIPPFFHTRHRKIYRFCKNSQRILSHNFCRKKWGIVWFHNLGILYVLHFFCRFSDFFLGLASRSIGPRHGKRDRGKTFGKFHIFCGSFFCSESIYGWVNRVLYLDGLLLKVGVHNLQ